MTIKIYTDGACSGNPGNGGWGALIQENDNVIMEEPLPGSPLFQEMKTFDFYSDKPVILKKVFISNNDRISKEIFYLPSLFLLLLVYLNQHKRKKIMRVKNEKK